MWTYAYTDELYHHGIKGQKWGVRRFEDANGHLTPAGIKRYGDSGQEVNKRALKEDYGRQGARDRRIKSAMAYRQQKKMARLDKKIDKLKKRNEFIRDFDDEEWQEIKRYRPEFAKKAEQSFNKIADHRDHKIRMAEIKRKNIDSRRNELIKNLSPAEIENGKKYARREVLGGVAMAALLPAGGVAQIGYGVHKYKQAKRINYGTSNS